MAAFRLQLFVVVEFEETIAGEKLQVSIKGFLQPKKKKSGFQSYLRTKKQAQVYCLYISVCTYSLSGVFNSESILYFMCYRQHRK